MIRPLSDGVAFEFPDRRQRWFVERDSDTLIIQSDEIPRERLSWIGWAMILACVLGIGGMATISSGGIWMLTLAIVIGGTVGIYARLSGPKHVSVRLVEDGFVANSGGLGGVKIGGRPSAIRYDQATAEIVFDGDQQHRVAVHPELGPWIADSCNDYLDGELEFPRADAVLPGRIEPFSTRDQRWLRVAVWGTWFASSASNAISIVHSGVRNDFSSLYIAGDLALRGGLLSLVGAFTIWMILKGLFARTRLDDVRHLTSRLAYGWVAVVLALFATGAVWVNMKPPTSTIDLVWNAQWFGLFGWIALTGLVFTSIGRRRTHELRELEQPVTFDFAAEGRDATAPEEATIAHEQPAK